MKTRLVLNHSTFVDGLLAVLKKLEKLPALQSIIPGRLSSGKKSIEPKLELRLTTNQTNNNKINDIRLLARKGTQFQEIYILYDYGTIKNYHDINNNDKSIEHKVLSYIKLHLNDDNIVIRSKPNNNINSSNDNDEKETKTLHSDKYLKFLK